MQLIGDVRVAAVVENEGAFSTVDFLLPTSAPSCSLHTLGCSRASWTRRTV